MTRPELMMLAAVVLPFLGALLIPLFRDKPNLREAVTLVTAVLLFVLVLGLLAPVLSGLRPSWSAGQIMPGIAIGFTIEPLGMLFAVVASGLWVATSIYSIGYMRAHDEPRQTGFYACFAVALGSTIGLAFAENLVTLFLFYEVLTISTFPLVAHHRDAAAMRSGRLYLLLLLGTSMVLLLPAIVATYVLAGTTDFRPGGVLSGKATDLALAVLLAFFAFGIGKAALMPFHFWLPAAMVAPTPVSALLHAVAVVKAGVFTIVKIVVYVFGVETLAATGASTWLIYAATFTLLAASIVALTRDNLKARLAYSTVSQLSYVVLGAALATAASVTGSGLHIVMHAAGKITLFFCAGAIQVAAHKYSVSELNGLGRRMPVTMFAFLIGSLSIIGLPPLGGTWSKWWIGLGAVDSGHILVLAALMLSSLLNVAYLLSIVGRAFFLAPDGEKHGGNRAHDHGKGIQEAPLACLIPLCATALLCVALFFGVDPIEAMVARAVLP